MIDPAHSSGLFGSIRQLVSTSLEAVQNRIELFSVEVREEKCRVIDLMFYACAALFLAMLAALVITGTIIFAFPPGARIWVAAVFSVLYVAAAVWAFAQVRTRLKASPPFSESIDQMRKDREWLSSLK